MINKKILAITGLFVLLGALSFLRDAEILDMIIGLRTHFLNKFIIAGTSPVTVFLIAISAPILVFWTRGQTRLAIPLILAVSISVISTYLLKELIARPRPDLAIDSISALVSASGFAFPSGHSAVAFSVIPVVNRGIPKLKWFWVIFAIFIAFTRMYVGVHYLSDVIFGGLLGLTVGLGVIHWRLDW